MSGNLHTSTELGGGPLAEQPSQLHSFKDEHKHYIDSELKVSLMDIKNNLFEQQFGFERQICNLVNKLTAYVTPSPGSKAVLPSSSAFNITPLIVEN